MLKNLIVLTLGASVLSGCNLFQQQEKAVPVNSQGMLEAEAEVADAKGNSLGKIDLMEVADGVLISLKLENVSAGEKAIHIHEFGKCEGPDFKSAGAHFNPTNKQHGKNNPKGFHLGDLPNIEADADGKVDLEFTAAGVTLKEGLSNSLLDADGSSFIIHEKADDYVTDPSGNSGSRIACGVILPK